MAAACGILVLSAALASAGVKRSGGSFMIPRDAPLSGGQTVASASMKLDNGIGEAGGGTLSGGGFRLRSGLMNVAAQPGSVTTITAVTKSTGTLDLAWTAPGADGASGGVVNGFYRLDYSSDPAHVFAPTTFKLELSTTVAAGAAQSLRLEGLLPNTTYFTKIYLADARKYFAEDSRRGDESTLADLPVDPVFSAVNPTSVTISWLLPAGGAAGFSNEASTTNFGALLPGGVVVTSRTPSGLQVSLTVAGLATNTTYFFKVASLNWQGDKNFTTVMATVTPSGTFPLPVLDLAAAPNPLSRRVSLSWRNPAFNGQQGVVVLLSTSPLSTSVGDGLAFAPGQTLGDASVVKSTAMGVSFDDAGLALDTTYFYHVYAQGQGLSYSVSVSTAVFLDLPPMAPAGLAGTLAADNSAITLRWKPVTSNNDGSAFASTAAPRAVEMAGYEVFRSSSLSRASWVSLGLLPVTASSFTAAIPDPDRTFLYKVVAKDSLGPVDGSMALDSGGNLYAFSSDQVTRLMIPRTLAGELTEEAGRYGSDVLIRAKDQPADAAGKVFRSVSFEAVRVPSNEVISPFQLSKAEVSVALAYEVSGGNLMSVGPNASVVSNIPAAAAVNSLGMYWNNGSKYVKFFGKVDPGSQTVAVNTAYAGDYQVRALVRDQAFSLDVSGVTNKAITPNADGLNDTVVFSFDNPRDSAISGRILDLRGAFICDIAAGPRPNTLRWDGKASGRVVPGGVYLYQIRGEGKTFSGTIMVIR